MVTFLFFAAVAEFVLGLLALMTAKSAIHEILGVLGIGFAIMTVGLGAILRELRPLSDVASRIQQRASEQQQADTDEGAPMPRPYD